MKFLTIIEVSDIPDKNGNIFTRTALRRMAKKDPTNLLYEEINGRGYLIGVKIIEISTEDFIKNGRYTHGGLSITAQIKNNE